MEKIIDIPVEMFLTVVSEIDFYYELIPDIKESREGKYIGRNHKIGYCLYDLPLLSLREAVFDAVGYNRLNYNNSIFMYSQTIHDKPDLCAKLDFEPRTN